MADSILRANTDEADRLARLRELVILDSAPEPLFDAIARLASEVCGTPIALLSLIDAERQWFKANVGLPGLNETPRDRAFCEHALKNDAVLEVPDATLDPRFSSNPLVTGAPDIRFYAGAPLELPGGQRVGALCVIDRQARRLSETQAMMLRSLAAIASQGLVMRRDLIDRTLKVRAQQEQLAAQSERFMRQIADNLPIRIAYVDRTLRYRFVNQAHCERFGMSRQQIVGRTRAELKNEPNTPDVEARVANVLKGQPQHFDFDEHIDGQTRRIESTLIPNVTGDGTVAGFFATGVDITERVKTERELRDLTDIIQNTTDYVAQVDAQGKVVFMNPAARSASGFSRDAPLAELNYHAFNTPETLQLHDEVIFPALKDSGVWVGTSAVYGANKREIPASHMVIAHRNDSGRIVRYSTVMRDISQAIQSERDALRQMNTLRAVTEAIAESVAVVGSDLRYRFVNGAYERSVHLPRDQIIGRTMRDVLGREAFVEHLPWLARALAGETVSFDCEMASGQGTMNLSISHAPLRVDDHGVDSVVTVARDTTLQRREEARLREISQRDPLTGLLNRAGLAEYVNRVHSMEPHALMAVLCIDLDDFKPINDGYGHAMGDEVLKRFSGRLQKLVRPTDGVARLGGDEFALVLPGLTDPVSARAVASKVIAAASKRFAMSDGLELAVTASVGIAVAPADDKDWSLLMARADANLYRAKAAGKGCVADDET